MDVERAEHECGNGGLRFDIERDLLCTTDANGYFQSLNAAWEQVLGWSREELMRRPLIELVHPDDVERTVEQASRIVRPDYQIVNFENRFRTKDRSIVAVAREFGLGTVAEGVEDEPTVRMLRDFGVDYVQGSLTGRPLVQQNG